MLHLLYILAFTILAFLAIANLIRSMMALGTESQRSYRPQGRSEPGSNSSQVQMNRALLGTHPELLDETGKVINEPLLVMRSMTVDDAREHLDALYDSSPGGSSDIRDDA
ncbi:MAG: DUF2973 domain-containing protein [Scytolyngbya sp. HA4215-MV1]|jgi:hypothetical protein|nr:DUF2973 domain-containing protein [Scytolyngbya sp. HA4215-MV1]